MTRASKSAGRPAHIINLTDDDNDPLLDSLIPNPGEWQIWPLVAVVRRLADISSSRCPVVYRSRPSLSFSAGEVVDMGVGAMGVEITLSAPGLAAPGSALPVACIARVIDDLHDGGVLAKWLDGPGDRFMQAVEHAQARNNMAFSLAVGGESTAMKIGSAIIGNCAPLSSDGQTESCDNWTGVPEGAIGLAAIFVGPITTSGLEQLFEAFTALPAHVVEFAGAEVATIRPRARRRYVWRDPGIEVSLAECRHSHRHRGRNERRSPEMGSRARTAALVAPPCGQLYRIGLAASANLHGAPSRQRTTGGAGRVGRARRPGHTWNGHRDNAHPGWRHLTQTSSSAFRGSPPCDRMVVTGLPSLRASPRLQARLATKPFCVHQ